jgi:hypothetical protein
MTEWTIVVLDQGARRFPPAKDLAKVGVPVRIIDRWRHVRWEMTTGLKRAVLARMN